MDIFPIIIVPDEADLTEQLGTKEKYWFCRNEGMYLFKLGRPNTGENWSEKVACELNELLSIPHAYYEFASLTWREGIGVFTPIIVPIGGRLILGNELLWKTDCNYPSQQLRKVQQHTLTRIEALMESPRADVLLPLDWKCLPQIETAMDVFVGYLLLDAWIGNTDRHHENWGFILTASGKVHLAPTFDHASSLGCHLTDDVRLKRLRTHDQGFDVTSYVTKARSAFYPSPDSKKPFTCIEVFQYLAIKRKVAALAWLDRLKLIDTDHWHQIFDRIPSEIISEIAKEFALQMIEINRSRLLNLRDELM